MKVAFYVLGCKVNQYEAQALSELFLEKGYEVVSSSQEADVYIIISCTVTKTGDSKSKKAVNHFRKKNENAVIVLMGCFPQAFPEKAMEIKSADIILGTKDRKSIIKQVEKALKEKIRIVNISEHPKKAEIEKLKISSFNERNRAFLKIQDGCNRFCSYCIIPYARGRICSKPLEDIKSEVEVLAKNGFSEIVLVGIDLSSYGKEFNKTLTDAVECTASVKGVKRIRLGSLEPEVISDNDIERLSKIESFCPQFHLSLQSGCDETLKRMNRHYNSDEYRKIVKKIRAAFKNAQITTDVMVGFAGETEEEFNASLDFVREMRFLKVHTFPYSVREKTRAAEFKNQVSAEEKKRRAHIMIEETEKIRKEILKEMQGKETEILIESRDKDGYHCGYTEGYIPVYIKGANHRKGDFARVVIGDLFKDGCLGTVRED